MVFVENFTGYLLKKIQVYMSKFERDISKILRGSFILVHPLEAHAAEGSSFWEQYRKGNQEKTIIHLSKDSVFCVRDIEYCLFYIQPPKAVAFWNNITKFGSKYL